MSHIEELPKNLADELKKGYEEMKELNLQLAGEGLASDNEALAVCEEKLMESE